MGKYRKSIVSLTSLFTFISLQRRKHCPCLSLVLNPFKSWSASMQCATGYDLTSLYMVFQCCISVIHKYRGGKMSAVKWSLTAYQLSSLFVFLKNMHTETQTSTMTGCLGVSGFGELSSFYMSINFGLLFIFLGGHCYIQTCSEKSFYVCIPNPVFKGWNFLYAIFLWLV